MTADWSLRTTTMVVMGRERELAGQRGEEGPALLLGVDMSGELRIEFLEVPRLSRGVLDEDARERPDVAGEALLGRGKRLRRERRARLPRLRLRRFRGGRLRAAGAPRGLDPRDLLHEGGLLLGVGDVLRERAEELPHARCLSLALLHPH